MYNSIHYYAHSSFPFFPFSAPVPPFPFPLFRNQAEMCVSGLRPFHGDFARTGVKALFSEEEGAAALHATDTEGALFRPFLCPPPPPPLPPFHYYYCTTAMSTFFRWRRWWCPPSCLGSSSSPNTFSEPQCAPPRERERGRSRRNAISKPGVALAAPEPAMQ